MQRLNMGFRKVFNILAVIILAMNASCVNGQSSDKQPEHIVFIEDAWSDALKQAKAQNKYIFVDAYASWCGPCKMLRATTFRNNKAAEFFNKNFVNISIDMEKGVGPQLAAAWQLQAYPTLIIFDPNGRPVLGSVGYINANDLVRFGQQALSKKIAD